MQTVTNPWCSLLVSPGNSYRNGRTFTPSTCGVQAVTLTWSWGSEPATASVVYVPEQRNTTSYPGQLAVPDIAVGDQLTLRVAGHTFWGVAVTPTATVGSGGHELSVQFADNRFFLDWDKVFGAFNIADDTLVYDSGKAKLVRKKRYKHVLPANYRILKWTYTDAPYTAAEIINFLLASDTVWDDWTCTYHAVMLTTPVYEIDLLGGDSLRSALVRISESVGTLFTLMGGPYSLVWVRKGEGVLPNFPPRSDAREVGTTFSGAGTRIRVLGERNLYQVHGIPMVKDWLPAWETFFSGKKLVDWVYENLSTTFPVTLYPELTRAVKTDGYTFPTGTPYKQIPNQFNNLWGFYDEDQIVARQLAIQRAMSITVGEFAALQSTPSNWLDRRLYQGRSRECMPAMLYIDQMLFRAYRLPETTLFYNRDGLPMDKYSCRIADKMVARVYHDGPTGNMTPVTDESADGNGFVVVQGFEIGTDMFKSLQPERFEIENWKNSQTLWAPIEFSVDDSGEPGSQFIILRNPAIKSENIIEMIDGKGVFKANPTINTPSVKAALTFEAERYEYKVGTDGLEEVVSASGLSAEYCTTYNTNIGPTEVVFSDGATADDKAGEITDSLTPRQFAYSKGRFSTALLPSDVGQFDSGTQLTGVIDRITLSVSSSSVTETVDLTAEAPRQHYIPERDLDRNALAKRLLPGQEELRLQVRHSKMTVSAINKDPSLRKTITEEYNTNMGANANVINAVVQ